MQAKFLEEGGGARRKEYEIKVKRGNINSSLLFGIGAEHLGEVIQKDTYLAAEDGRTWRIREENGKYVFTQKGHDISKNSHVRVKEVLEKLIDKAEACRLAKAHKIRTVICKTSTLFRLKDGVIAVDDVEHLGEFVEIRSTDEQGLFRILKTLELKEAEVIKESYLDMILSKSLPKWLQSLIRFHDRVGELIFGITSGVLTAVGMLVGMDAATGSRLAVIAGILVIAIADSLSDSFGMYLSKLGERGNSQAVAFRYGLGTFAGKFIFPLTFVVPLLVSSLSLRTAVVIDLAWGAVALSLLSAEQALVSQKSVIRIIGRNIGLATLVVVLSGIIGAVVSGFV